jgi:serine/threonine protein kinase/Tol biopolymer transport system component
VALVPGSRLGAYEVVSLLGEGGMGQVYRARDSRLKRDVALKILPDAFAADPDRMARFQREAELLATLNHPNIAGIYGLEQVGGVRALVLEIVEGPTLADRIAHGSIPVDEALLIASQIAGALEAAHEKGIVHRDLKPANIKLTPEDKVKILDFGLAKTLEPALATPADLTHSPTVTSPALTQVGMILGTAAYLSPEQARGRGVDKRADVWAFGCVLYEMLSGCRPFAGATLTEVLAAIVRDEPEWTLLPQDTPPAIRGLIKKCLRKDPGQRIRDIGDVRIEIEDARANQTPDEAAVDDRTRRKALARWVWASLFGVFVVVAALAAATAFRSESRASEMRFEITTPPTGDPASIAISPDGRTIVFVGAAVGASRLFVRAVDSTSARALAGTEGATYPFWSPDSRSLAFFADGKLKRIEIDGGPAQTLANAASPRGGTWNKNGTLLFAPLSTGPIFRVSASGGEPVQVTRFGPGEQGSHRFPHFLPDGRHFLYYWFGTPARGVHVADLDGRENRRLVDSDTAAVYALGHVLFARQGTLFAQDFDPDRLSLSGSPSVVGERVAVDPASFSLGAFAVSSEALVVFRTVGVGRSRQLVWVDRSGRTLETAGDPHDGVNPSLSPDGRRVAIYQTVNGNTDVWILELARHVFTRFTSGDTLENYAIWSPDSRSIVFGSNPKGHLDLYRKPADGVGAEDLLLSTTETKNAFDWSSDGRFILYRAASLETGYDLWALPLQGDRKPFPVVQSRFTDRDGQFSPDGKWIAFQSDESGHFEVYVQPFPGPGARVQVSFGGGAQVRWPRSNELFYVAFDNRLMSVPITSKPDKSLDFGTPVPLFMTNIGGAVQSTLGHQYSVSSDGQRFLMNNLTEAALPMTVVLNWNPNSRK